MSARIRLRSHQIADLARIRDVGVPLLSEIVKALRSQEKPPLRPKQLQQTIQSIVDDADVAEALMRPLLSLYGLVQQTNFSVAEVIEGLRVGLHPSVSDWSDDEFAEWEAVESCVTFIEYVRGACTLICEEQNLASDDVTLIRGRVDGGGGSLKISFSFFTALARHRFSESGVPPR